MRFAQILSLIGLGQCSEMGEGLPDVHLDQPAVILGEGGKDHLGLLMAEMMQGKISKEEFDQAIIAEGKAHPQQSCAPEYNVALMMATDEWIIKGEGDKEVDMEGGAVTLVFFFSIMDPKISHKVLPVIEELHQRHKSRGLNVIGVHSTPTGYKSNEKMIRTLKKYIENLNLTFPIVDAHFKDGDEPMMESQSEQLDYAPDYATSRMTHTSTECLWNMLAAPDDRSRKVGFAQAQPYGVPAVFVLKHCNIVTTTGGLDIAKLGKKMEAHWDDVLWAAPKTKTVNIESKYMSEEEIAAKQAKTQGEDDALVKSNKRWKAKENKKKKDRAKKKKKEATAKQAEKTRQEL